MLSTIFRELSAIFIKYEIVVCKLFQFVRFWNSSFGNGLTMLQMQQSMVDKFAAKLISVAADLTGFYSWTISWNYRVWPGNKVRADRRVVLNSFSIIIEELHSKYESLSPFLYDPGPYLPSILKNIFLHFSPKLL